MIKKDYPIWIYDAIDAIRGVDFFTGHNGEDAVQALLELPRAFPGSGQASAGPDYVGVSADDVETIIAFVLSHKKEEIPEDLMRIVDRMSDWLYIYRF